MHIIVHSNLNNTISTITMTTRTVVKIAKTTIIPPKTTGVALLPAVLMGISSDEAGVVGKLQVEGCCVTTTPVNKNKLR